MQHDKFRMVLRSTVGAVILMPAIALAQGNTGSPSQGTTQGSGSEATGAQGSASPDSRSQHSGAKWSGSEDTTKQGSSGSQGSSAGTSGSATDPMAGSQSADLSRSQSGSASSASSSASRQSIDPAEVQRVFGTDATVVDLQTLGPEQIRSVQQSLQERGLYKGAIDGVYGPQTRAGLKAMLNQQHSLNQRLINQGQVTGPLAASMGIQQSDIAPVAGSDAPSGGGSGIRSQPSPQGTQPSGMQPSGMQPSGMQPSGSSTSPTTGSSSGSRSTTGSPSGTGSAGSSGSSPGASGTQYPR